MKNDLAKYAKFIEDVRHLVDLAKSNVSRKINTELLLTYWNIGRLIVEKEALESIDEQSSRKLILDLSKVLTVHIGKGFSRSNLFAMRRFYQVYKFVQTLSGHIPLDAVQTMSGVITFDAVQTLSGHANSRQPTKKKDTSFEIISKTIELSLSWSHYIELLKVDNDIERSFYQKQSINENWSVRELQRQKDSAIFERIALNKDMQGVMDLAKKGHTIENHLDFSKDPYVLEFLNIGENESLSESQLEQKIIDNLQKFILELGKGFAFVGRQFRISLDNKHYYVDLVFYHRILKCFVLIDLKVKEVGYDDIGQMNMYLNYFEAEQNVEGDGEPLGIILTRSKGNIMVEYAMKGISTKIMIKKYQLYLPDKKELQKRVQFFYDQKKLHLKPKKG